MIVLVLLILLDIIDQAGVHSAGSIIAGRTGLKDIRLASQVELEAGADLTHIDGLQSVVARRLDDGIGPIEFSYRMATTFAWDKVGLYALYGFHGYY